MKVTLSLVSATFLSFLLTFLLKDHKWDWTTVALLAWALSFFFYGQYAAEERLKAEIGRALSHAIMNGKNPEVQAVKPFFKNRKLVS